MHLRRGLAVASLLSAGTGTLQAAVYFDGTFIDADWSLTTIVNASAAGSSAAGNQIASGGNGGPYRFVRHSLTVSNAGNGAVTGLHLNANSFYDPSVQGPVTSINYSEDSIAFLGPGSVQAGGLYILQGGNSYVQRNPFLTMPLPAFSGWTANPASGLVAADFYRIDGAGTLFPFSNPDFSGSGGVMQLGFWRGNSNNGNVVTEAGIDNWRVEIIPAPGAAGVLGMGALLAWRRRR
ncbi:MAG: hypothetical protein K2Q20_07910 [Phycisphaerales bacterium]|nr:hypothetical protein [Phycisphaerales bacterium]